MTYCDKSVFAAECGNPNCKKCYPLKEAREGQWYVLDDGHFIHKCCECGLEHKVETMIEDKKVAIRFFRNDLSISNKD